MSIADSLAADILRREFTQAGVWLAIHDGGGPEDGITELPVGRVRVVFAEPAGRECSLRERAVWDPMPECTVTHWSAWTAPAGGSIKWTGMFDEPTKVRAGEGFRTSEERPLTVVFE